MIETVIGTQEIEKHKIEEIEERIIGINERRTILLNRGKNIEEVYYLGQDPFYNSFINFIREGTNNSIVTYRVPADRIKIRSKYVVVPEHCSYFLTKSFNKDYQELKTILMEAGIWGKE